jgi:tetratricopeptide (TPR) repeat protein
MRRLLVFAFLLLFAIPVHADTASGIAAYERGDYAAALELLKPEAENGDPLAQVKLGLIHAKGLGVPRDPAAAVPWFRKSAEQGNAEGQYSLGVAYDLGDTGAPDPEQAAIWYRRSAEQGYARAQYNLGHMMLNGGDPSRYEEGAAWTLKAAEQDMADAMYLYGNACGGGRGVPSNLLCARYWLGRAVAGGATGAAKSLAIAEKGIAELEAAGVPKTAGGDGSSPGRAIVLPEAKTSFDGVPAERKVVAAYFQGWKWGDQALLNGPDGVYDRIGLTGPDGATRMIYFDIGAWFGRLE